ncbi:MAG: 3-deoxy-7-phosphoheptulonate synthase [Geminicoccaceae bacterium]
MFAGEAHTSRRGWPRSAPARRLHAQGAATVREAFADFPEADKIRDTLRVLLQMAIVLTFGGGLPVVKLGRIAGQFAKPRSADMEEIGGESLPSYRGDIVNGIEFDEASRVPDPARQLQACSQAAAALNLCAPSPRAAMPRSPRYTSGRWAFWIAARKASDTVTWRADHRGPGVHAGLRGHRPHHARDQHTQLYTSHEALLLGFEQAMTRVDSTSGRWYDTSAHFLWVGDHARQLDGAHVEFCRGIASRWASRPARPAGRGSARMQRSTRRTSRAGSP